MPVTVSALSHQRFSMVSRTLFTMSGAARVPTPLEPIGQSEFSMSTVCWARKPGGVFLLIFTPASAVTDDADGVEPLHTRPLTTATAASDAAARRSARLALRLRAGPCNVQHNLELQQRRSGRHRIRSVPRVGLDGRTGRPRLERFFGLPLRHHEIPVLAFDGSQQLKAEESRRVLDSMCSMGESLFQFGPRLRRHLY